MGQPCRHRATHFFLPFLACPGGVPPGPGGPGAVVVGLVAVVVTVVVVVLVLLLEVDDGVLELLLGVDLECELELVTGCDELWAGAEPDEVDLLEPPLASA